MSECAEAVAALESVFGCRVCFHDYDGRVIACAGPFPLSHRNRFCECVTDDRRDFLLCCEMEAVMSRSRLQSERRPFVKRCHAGVFEIVAPVFYLGSLTGAMFIGPFQEIAEPDGGGRLLRQRAKSARQGKFDEARKALPSLDAKGAANLVVFAGLLSKRIEESFQVESGMEEGAPNERKIRHFIDRCFRKEAYLADLAAVLGVGEVRACQILRELFGCGFSKLLAARRVEHARYLLKESTLKTSAIASECGFHDPAYFFKVFKDSAGMTPGEYRARFQLKAPPEASLRA